MKKGTKKPAVELHERVPPNWYYQSLRVDLLKRIWHKRRFSEVEKLIEPSGGRILDIGCADGMFSKVVFDKSKADEYIGIDILKTSIAWAKNHWRKYKNMKFEVGDAHDLKFKSSSFDAVIILEVLEHVTNPVRVIREVKRILKKGGYAILLVPSDSFLFRLVWFLWLHFYPRGWVWRETHIQTYRKNYLPKICKEVGFKIEEEKKFNKGMLHLVKLRKV
jgi:2-polyprenyl-3-methyl-5-hydroxy-6-metoxy-1,4-benzoquinol methylase